MQPNSSSIPFGETFTSDSCLSAPTRRGVGFCKFASGSLESATFQGWKRDNKSFSWPMDAMRYCKRKRICWQRRSICCFWMFLIPVALSIFGLAMMHSPWWFAPIGLGKNLEPSRALWTKCGAFRGECQGLVVQDWKAALLGVSSLQCSWQRQRVLAWLEHAIPPKKTADLWYLAVWGASEINVPIPYLMYPNDPPTEINVPIQNGGHWRGDATGVIGRGITNVLTFKASYIFQSFLKCPTFLLFRAGTAFYNHIDGNDSGDWIECY